MGGGDSVRKERNVIMLRVEAYRIFFFLKSLDECLDRRGLQLS